MFSDRTNWRLARNRLTQAVDEVRAGGAKILDLTVSNPTRIGLAYDSGAILSALGSARALDYDPQAKGLPEARRAVAEYYREQRAPGQEDVAGNVSTHGVEVDPERIVLTASTSEGYSYVFRLLCNGGDELLVPKPSYPLFEFLADLQDVKLVPYPLIYDHGWQMDFPSLEKAVTARTRGVVVVHPNNPTGSYVQAGEWELLNDFCRAHGLALIVDEVFLDYGLGESAANSGSLHAPNDRHPPVLELGRDDSVRHDTFAGNTGVLAVELSSTMPKATNGAVALRATEQPRAAVPTWSVPTWSLPRPSFVKNDATLTFTLSGLSKISALPQMKVAWVVTSGPSEMVEAAMARLEMIADTYLSMNAPVQWALPVLLGQRKNIQAQLMERVRQNLEELDRQLAKQSACERLRVEGGWYAVVRVPVTRSDDELVIELLRERSVLVHPGHYYDFPGDGYLVLSLIAAPREFADGVARMLQMLP